ncbi:hypothetical protein H4219_003737 [Mycoemilia scoparia]|uniref:Uncharacterized protein n=1 Tax=Mycoemilia scoparia TaxID=417184 RepID=A0A9W7ZTV9_9FUNG|nr:hypothetical protein H4219_003737 [Mycoemilia scoparia]
MSILKSDFGPISIPDTDLPSFIFQSIEDACPDTNLTALVDGSSRQSISYKQLKTLSFRFASLLQNKLKVHPGDVVLIFAPNHILYPVVVLGIHLAGAIASPTNPGFTQKELTHQIKDSEAKAIVTIKALSDDIVKKAIIGTNISESKLVLLDTEPSLSTTPHPTTTTTTDDIENGFKRYFPKPNDLAFINYSSGTTGFPKGVMLTHTNIISNICQIIALESHDPIVSSLDRTQHHQMWLGVLPFFHIYGLTVVLLLALVKGHGVVVIPKFNVQTVLECIQAYKITVAPVVPPIILQLSQYPGLLDKYKLDSLVYLMSAAAPLGKNLEAKASRRLGGVPIIQAYGLTETSPLTHKCFVKGSPSGSVGKLVPNIELKIVVGRDEKNGKEILANIGSTRNINDYDDDDSEEVGEICVRGPNLMLGYLRNQEANSESIDSDGFFHTGDIGYVDKNGFMFISDRKKELIKYKGFQIAPAELEAMLVLHPKVSDAAVIPAFDKERHSEVPKAFIVLSNSNPSDHNAVCKEVKEWVNRQVANHKQLRGGVEAIDEIPKNPSGKILRKILRERERLSARNKIKQNQKLASKL